MPEPIPPHLRLVPPPGRQDPSPPGPAEPNGETPAAPQGRPGGPPPGFGRPAEPALPMPAAAFTPRVDGAASAPAQSDAPVDAGIDGGVDAPADGGVDAGPPALTAPGRPATAAERGQEIAGRVLGGLADEYRRHITARGADDPSDETWARFLNSLRQHVAYHIAAPWVPQDGRSHPVILWEGRAYGFTIGLVIFCAGAALKFVGARQSRGLVLLGIALIVVIAHYL